jgi:hypothetical protein
MLSQVPRELWPMFQEIKMQGTEDNIPPMSLELIMLAELTICKIREGVMQKEQLCLII